MEIFTINISSWKIHELIVSVTGINFVKFLPKRSTPKWTSNKMDNAKKGHNKTGRVKVVLPKRRASYSHQPFNADVKQESCEE